MAGRKVLGCLFFLGFDFFFLFAFSFLVVLAKMKTVFFVAFVVVLFFCADSASCQTNHTFPSYGNYFSYYYSVFFSSLFPLLISDSGCSFFFFFKVDAIFSR